MKTLLLGLSLFSALVAASQTITADDTLYSGMGNTYYVMDSTAASFAAVTGTGVTWDYSTLLGEEGVAVNYDTIQDAADSDFDTDYPMAAYNDDMNNGASVFFSNNADSMTIWGFVLEVDAYEMIIRHSTNPLIGLKYPMNLGDSYSDSTYGEVEIAGNVGITAGEGTVTVDGFGTLNVSGNTYTNITRIKLVETVDTEIDVDPFGIITGTVTRTIYSYYDYANDVMPVFVHGTIDVTSTAFNGGYTAVYYHDLPYYAGVSEMAEFDFTVYPNPAADYVTVTTDGTADQLSVINALGEAVLIVAKPQPVEQLGVASLEAGIYIIQVKKGNAVSTEKLIVE